MPDFVEPPTFEELDVEQDKVSGAQGGKVKQRVVTMRWLIRSEH